MIDQSITPFWKQHGLPAPGTHMTASEFQALPEVNFHVELIDGVVIYPHASGNDLPPTPFLDHQEIVGNIYGMLWNYGKAHGGKAAFAPLNVYLSEKTHVQPDIIWFSPKNEVTRTDKSYNGAPDLVVEVLSPSTAARDRGIKFDQYQAHSVREYWIVDPPYRLMEIYTLKNGSLQRFGVHTTDDIFLSPVLAELPVSVHEIFDI